MFKNMLIILSFLLPIVALGSSAIDFGNTGVGTVTAPGTVTDGAAAAYDGTDGKLLQDTNLRYIAPDWYLDGNAQFFMRDGYGVFWNYGSAHYGIGLNISGFSPTGLSGNVMKINTHDGANNGFAIGTGNGGATLFTVAGATGLVRAFNDLQVDDDLVVIGDTTLSTSLTGVLTATSGVVSTGSVPNSSLANMAEGTLKGRAIGAGTGAPADLTAAQAQLIVGTVPQIVSHQSTPSNPSSGNAKIYVKSDDKLYLLNSSGVETEIGSGGGGSSSCSTRISDASLSRVTGSDPSSLGQYRSMLRTGSTNSFSDSNGAPTATPGATNGFRIYNGLAFGNTDNNNEPTHYRIYIGTGKRVFWKFYLNTGRTGFIDTTPTFDGNIDSGYQTYYDETTGIATITRNFIRGSSSSGHQSGIGSAGNDAVNDPYFDIYYCDL